GLLHFWLMGTSVWYAPWPQYTTGCAAIGPCVSGPDSTEAIDNGDAYHGIVGELLTADVLAALEAARGQVFCGAAILVAEGRRFGFKMVARRLVRRRAAGIGRR